MLPTCPGKKDILKEFTREIRNFSKIIISEKFIVSNNFVSEGNGA